MLVSYFGACLSKIRRIRSVSFGIEQDRLTPSRTRVLSKRGAARSPDRRPYRPDRRAASDASRPAAYGWRTQIRTLLAKGKSLAEIAETLNRKDVPPAHGTNRWTAAMVRKAYVS
jgi:hypothetical protein